MHITISYPPGFTTEAVVLFAGRSTMRLAVKGWDDATQIRFHQGQWLSENGDVVTIGRPPKAGAWRAAGWFNG
jgi:hypothetical protein